jgi:N-acetylmuramoyl-L-alanine amidase
MAKLLYLDPGHGGYSSGGDPGAVNVEKGTKEAAKVLEMALKTGDYIMENYEGVEIKYTRKTDVFVPLSERAAMANRDNAFFFCSFHLNSHSDKNANGFETFVYPTSGSTTKQFQRMVHDSMYQVLKEYGIVNRGYKTGNLSVLRNTKMGALLLEVLFLSNNKECDLINNPQFMEKICAATGDGLAKVCGLTRKESPKRTNMYRINVDGANVGAFAEENNVLNVILQRMRVGSKKITLEKVE